MLRFLLLVLAVCLLGACTARPRMVFEAPPEVVRERIKELQEAGGSRLVQETEDELRFAGHGVEGVYTVTPHEKGSEVSTRLYRVSYRSGQYHYRASTFPTTSGYSTVVSGGYQSPGWSSSPMTGPLNHHLIKKHLRKFKDQEGW